ncbi:phosphatase PAP2 family protein [Pedobacter frigoris]|uniref:phosphatase PAP2 family protein n=1 Tax=Pedobacter frigoris TaxID=2571272 RepID=UPI0029307624|nr:phosphatase PAP2 family protein [Pedobacter frigoris]
MLKLKYSFLLLICFPFISQAQYNKNTDSLKKDNRLKIAPFIIPTVFIGYGIAAGGNNPIRDLDRTTRAELQEDHPFFSVHVDNFIQYAPAAAVYGLNLSGIKGKNDLLDATGIYAVSMAIMTASVRIVKSQTNRIRPDGTTDNSFPSGHTATSFAAAEFLKQEYKDVSPWIGYAGYAVAGTTGILRLYNNRHWVSDVVAGAGFGIISTKLGYFVYPHLKKLIMGKHSSNFNLSPLYQDKKAGFSFSGNF